MEALADIYPGSTHVHACGLGSATDEAVWEYAKARGLTIVSKDSDFQERSILRGAPPKVIWLRAANCTAGKAGEILRDARFVVMHFVNEDEESCLLLS